MQKIVAIHRGKEGVVSLKGVGVETAPPRRSIIDHIMSHKYPSEDALLTDLWLMILAGHETSASMFCFLMLEITRNPTVKDKLKLELTAFMPQQLDLINSVDDDKELLSAIAGCEYLSNCIKESLRLWPTVTGLSRCVQEDIILNEKILIPAGVIVIVNHYAMFRSQWITNSNTFDPDRWLDSNPQLPILKQMFMPFSAGKRSCIGQNMAMFQLRILTAHFIHYFDFELMSEPSFEYFLTLKPRSMMMKVHRCC